MRGRRRGFLPLGLLLSGALLSAETAFSLGPTRDRDAVLNEEETPRSGRLTLEIHCWTQDEVKEFLIFTINQGTPLFNGGDHYGCYRIYDFAAKRIIWGSAHCPDRPELLHAGEVLQAALERAGAVPTAKEKAWVLRRAFDVVLEGHER